MKKAWHQPKLQLLDAAATGQVANDYPGSGLHEDDGTANDPGAFDGTAAPNDTHDGIS